MDWGTEYYDRLFPKFEKKPNKGQTSNFENISEQWEKSSRAF